MSRSLPRKSWKVPEIPWKPIPDGLQAVVTVLLGYVLLGLLTLWPHASVLRAPLAAVLALFGPGYALMAVLFPGRGELDAVERAALAGGLSLAVGGVLGFVLAESPWGLTSGSVLVASALFSVGCLVWVRRMRVGGGQITAAPAARTWRADWQQWWADDGRGSRATTVLLAALLVGGAVALGWTLWVPAGDPPMTEFYLLNDNGQAQDYPTAIAPGQSLPLTFGVTNREGDAASYRVHAAIAGHQLATAGPRSLEPGETWHGKLELWLAGNVSQAWMDAAVIHFVLERDGLPHRSLHLWMTVEHPAPAALEPTGGQ